MKDNTLRERTRKFALWVVCTGASVSASFLLSFPALSAEPLTLKLWPEGVPGKPVPVSEATRKQIASYGTNPNRVTNVTNPEITVYRPEKPKGASVIVAPGGAYMWAPPVTRKPL